MSFRADINGLRSLAVTSVLLYHFKVPGFAGGFVGGDVFLVISGFLMTQILVRSIERGDLADRPLQSILRFYEACPADRPGLGSFVAGHACRRLVLSPRRGLYLSSEAVFALLFLSNMKYYCNPEGNVVGEAVGYFADTDYTRWLLHSWSLSLEWQFYIVYPFLLWLIWRIARRQGMFVTLLVLEATRPGKDYRCREFADHVAKRLRELPAGIPLVIATRASYYLYGPNEKAKRSGCTLIDFKQIRPVARKTLQRSRQIDTLCQFAKRRPVYLLSPIPELKISVPSYVARRTMAGLSCDISIQTWEYASRNRFVLDVQRQVTDRCGIKLLDRVPYLCFSGHCRGTRDGLPLYDDHLSERGGRLLLPLFKVIHPAVVGTTTPASFRKTD